MTARALWSNTSGSSATIYATTYNELGGYAPFGIIGKYDNHVALIR